MKAVVFVSIYFQIFVKLIQTQQSESLTFQQVRHDAKVVGLEPFFNQNTSSLTECYLECRQQLPKCSFLEVRDSNETWSCRLFNLSSSTKQIESNLQASKGGVVSKPKLPTDCEALKRLGFQDGVYNVRFKGWSTLTQVYCDMITDGGGWIVMQKRFDGSVVFDRVWNMYRDGFGDVDGEYWLGNEFVHQYTKAYPGTEMMAEGTAFDGDQVSVKLKNFRLGDESSNYILRFDTCAEVVGAGNHCEDWIGPPDQANLESMQFTTIDQDNDEYENENCARSFSGGGWWYNSCFAVNLNGKYPTVEQVGFATRIHWRSFRTHSKSLKKTKMLLRRV